MSSYLVYSFTWTVTSDAMSAVATMGPANAPYQCIPNYLAQYTTFTWVEFGNGCPYNYAYNLATTCIYTGAVINSMTWQCTFTPSTLLTSTVFGGTTTLGSAATATITAPAQWITVTQTQQASSTLTSVVDPGAQTVTVTSTQAPQGRRSIDPFVKLQPGKLLALDYEDPETWNSTELLKRVTCPYTNEINCGSLVGQTCVNGGYQCCNGWACVPFNEYAPFISILYWSAAFHTVTSTIWSTITTYSIANNAAKTVTTTPTSTSQIIQTQVQMVTVFSTATGGTVTSTVVITPTTTEVPTKPQTTPTTPISVIGGSPTLAPTPPPSNLGLKIGAGVGAPLGVAIIAALLFFFLRRRKRGDEPPPSSNQIESYPSSPATSSRPVSELPPYPYTSLAAAAASIVRKPTAKPDAISPVEPHDIQHYSNQKDGYVYESPVSPGNELATGENRYEMPDAVQEMHELPGVPGHYGQ